MLLEYDESLDTTRSTELYISQIIVFPFWVNRGVSPFSTHMNIRVLSKAYEAIKSLAFHRVIALLRTDRNHEQKLMLTRLFALHLLAVSCLWFLTFSKYPLYPSSILLARHCALKLLNLSQTYDLLCLWRLHKKLKRSYLRLELAYFLAIPRCSCLGVSSDVLASKSGAQGFRSWSSDCLFPEFNFVPDASQEFHGVSRQSVQSQFLLFSTPALGLLLTISMSK